MGKQSLLQELGKKTTRKNCSRSTRRPCYKFSISGDAKPRSSEYPTNPARCRHGCQHDIPRYTRRRNEKWSQALHKLSSQACRLPSVAVTALAYPSLSETRHCPDCSREAATRQCRVGAWTVLTMLVQYFCRPAAGIFPLPFLPSGCRPTFHFPMPSTCCPPSTILFLNFFYFNTDNLGKTTVKSFESRLTIFLSYSFIQRARARARSF